MQATLLWSLWQALLAPFAPAFTPGGFRSFAVWATGLALNVEEHTITQSLVGLDRAGDWKALETFAEYGHWDERLLQWGLAWGVDPAPGRLWHGPAWAVAPGGRTKASRFPSGLTAGRRPETITRGRPPATGTDSISSWQP